MKLQLNQDMVDFDTRGFAGHDREVRTHLEERARAFIEGFNVAATDWRRVHDALQRVQRELRGFAYEGAGMYAGLRAKALGTSPTARHLLAGRGDAYRHLIHVGWGWGSAPLRTRVVTPLAPTPVLRWLGLDGAGFGLAFFGGAAKALRSASRTSGERRRALAAGIGRSLWFATSADPKRIVAVVAAAPEADAREMWAGVGLAAAYAGAGDQDAQRVYALAELSGKHLDAFRQGLLFGVTAHATAGVPAPASLQASDVLRLSPEECVRIADAAQDDLANDLGIEAYGIWRNRIRTAVSS
jgi:hypothetical protein